VRRPDQSEDRRAPFRSARALHPSGRLAPLGRRHHDEAATLPGGWLRTIPGAWSIVAIRGTESCYRAPTATQRELQLWARGRFHLARTLGPAPTCRVHRSRDPRQHSGTGPAAGPTWNSLVAQPSHFGDVPISKRLDRGAVLAQAHRRPRGGTRPTVSDDATERSTKDSSHPSSAQPQVSL
jgi:hypothetical protein